MMLPRWSVRRSGESFGEGFSGDGLHPLRAALVAHAHALGAPGALVDRLLVVANELATNAVRHAGGRGWLWLWREGPVLRCEVSDHGPGLSDAPAAGGRRPPLGAQRGRGLWLARQLSDELGIRTGPDGTTVTAAFRLHPT